MIGSILSSKRDAGLFHEKLLKTVGCKTPKCYITLLDTRLYY